MHLQQKLHTGVAQLHFSGRNILAVDDQLQVGIVHTRPPKHGLYAFQGRYLGRSSQSNQSALSESS